LNAETPITGQSSQQVGINRNQAGGDVKISVMIIFSANPGVFEYDIQGCDVPDADANYFTEGQGQIQNAVKQSDGTYQARVELSPWVASLMRLKCVTQNANAVTTKAIVTLH
jgi:hypothetical protein